MNKKILACVSVLIGIVTVLPTYAADLMQVYRRALVSDPTFKKAQADWLSAKENLPIAMTGNGTPGSGLFPYLDFSGNINRTYQEQTIAGTVTGSGYYNGNAYLLTLTQPIFNYQTWKSISSARYSVKAATATYLAAAQDLMFRVAEAYFNVLSANDQLRYTLSQKQAFLRQLITAEQKFKVGLIAITGVYDAQASYDRSVADEIKDRNNLANQIENLRAITSIQYKRLKGLRKSIPLVIPRPSNIEEWVQIADKQNYTIKSDLYLMLAAHEIIKENAAARYPTLNASASYGAVTSGVLSGINRAAPNSGGGVSTVITTLGTVQLGLDFPIFQGGHVFATTKQAEYNYLSSSDQLEFQHRTVMNQTRQAFLGVQSGISQIQADVQAIKSARNKLEATQAGYVVGTRTMVDVLNAVTALTQAQQAWADDRYSYVISIITLKQQAGTLSPQDLAGINAWLHKTEVFHPEKKVQVSRHASTPLPGPTTFAAPPKGGQSARIFHQPLKKSNKATTPSAPTPQETTKTLPTTPSTKTLPRSQQVQTHYYAIQIYASQNLEKAHEFIKRQTLKMDMQIIYERYHNQDWYKVIYGNYATRTSAENSLKQLPLELEKYKPWVIRVPKNAKRLSSKPMAALPKPKNQQQAHLSSRITSFKLNQQSNNADVGLPKP